MDDKLVKGFFDRSAVDEDSCSCPRGVDMSAGPSFLSLMTERIPRGTSERFVQVCKTERKDNANHRGE